MQNSSAPPLLQAAWAVDATQINTVPLTYGGSGNIPSWVNGFPMLNFISYASGGKAPDGTYLNGALNNISALTQWATMGGVYAWNSTWAGSTYTNGYAQGSRVASSDFNSSWISTADNNTSNPETTLTTIPTWLPGPGVGVLNITTGLTTTTIFTALQASYKTIEINQALVADTVYTWKLPLFPGMEWTFIFNNLKTKNTTIVFINSVTSQAFSNAVVTSDIADSNPDTTYNTPIVVKIVCDVTGVLRKVTGNDVALSPATPTALKAAVTTTAGSFSTAYSINKIAYAGGEGITDNTNAIVGGGLRYRLFTPVDSGHAVADNAGTILSTGANTFASWLAERGQYISLINFKGDPTSIGNSSNALQNYIYWVMANTMKNVMPSQLQNVGVQYAQSGGTAYIPAGLYTGLLPGVLPGVSAQVQGGGLRLVGEGHGGGQYVGQQTYTEAANGHKGTILSFGYSTSPGAVQPFFGFSGASVNAKLNGFSFSDIIFRAEGATSWKSSSAVSLQYCSQVNFTRVAFVQGSQYSAGVNPAVALVDCDNVVFDHCVFMMIAPYSHGIVDIVGSGTGTCTNYTFRNCTFFIMGCDSTGSPDITGAIKITGYVDNVTVEESCRFVFMNTASLYVDAICTQTSSSSPTINGLVINNPKIETYSGIAAAYKGIFLGANSTQGARINDLVADGNGGASGTPAYIVDVAGGNNACVVSNPTLKNGSNANLSVCRFQNGANNSVLNLTTFGIGNPVNQDTTSRIYYSKQYEPGIFCNNSSSQAITANTSTAINFQNKVYDPKNEWTSSNVFTPNDYGFYKLSLELSAQNTASGSSNDVTVDVQWKDITAGAIVFEQANIGISNNNAASIGFSGPFFATPGHQYQVLVNYTTGAAGALSILTNSGQGFAATQIEVTRFS